MFLISFNNYKCIYNMKVTIINKFLSQNNSKRLNEKFRFGNSYEISSKYFMPTTKHGPQYNYIK